MEPIRPHPRHGWLAAVIPAGARTFRVQSSELAVAITEAGGEIVDERPDVEIGTAERVVGDAPCAIVEVGRREPVARRRFVRGGQRLLAAARLRRETASVRRGLVARGYRSVDVLNWERGITLASGDPNGRQLAHRFPLNAVVVARNDERRTILDEVVATAESAIDARLELNGYVLGASGVIIARTDSAVLRVAVGPAARRITEQVETLRLLAQANPPETMAARVPWTLASGRSGLAVWSIEQALPETGRYRDSRPRWSGTASISSSSSTRSMAAPAPGFTSRSTPRSSPGCAIRAAQTRCGSWPTGSRPRRES